MTTAGNYKAYNIIHKINYWKDNGEDPSFLFEGLDINWREISEVDWLDFDSQVSIIWNNELRKVPDPREHIKLGYDVHRNQSMGAMETAAKLFSLKFIFKKFADLGRQYSLVEAYDVCNVRRNSAVIIYSPKIDFYKQFTFASPNFVKGFLASMPKIHQPASTKNSVVSDAVVDLKMTCSDVQDVLLCDYRWLSKDISVEEVGDKLFVNGKNIARKINLATELVEQAPFSNGKGIKKGRPIYKGVASGEQVNLENELKRQGTGYLITDDLVINGTVVLKNGEIFNAPYCRFNVKWSGVPIISRVKYMFNDVPYLLRSSRKSLLKQIEISDQRYFNEMKARQDEYQAKKALEKAHQQLKDYAENLEEKVEERTAELRETQAKLLESEKRSLEHRITGGFAHEMRNALAGAQLEFKTTLNFNDKGKTLAELLKDSATTLLKNISQIHNKYNIPRDEIANHFIPELKTIADISEHLSETISGVSRDLDRGLSITSKIRDYAKMSEFTVGDTPVDLVSLLKGYQKQYHHEFDEHGIQYSVSGLEKAIIRADEIHLNSIFSNLILNAKDALSDSKIEAPQIYVSVENSDAKILVKVQDNGPGIKKEHLQEIFEPFFSTKPTSGTGLGLGIVKRLVQLYKGQINLKSEIGNRTIFTITLPGDNNG